MNQSAEFPNVRRIGTTVTFYVPAKKLDEPEYGRDGLTPSQLFERFFIEHFGGFTHEESRIQGYWATNQTKTVIDKHEQYEVAVAGDAQAAEFFRFLSEICGMLREESIYLTYDGGSWLVSPSGD